MTPSLQSALAECGLKARNLLPAAGLPGVLSLQVPGDRATAAWVTLARAFPRTGVWPILRGESVPSDVYEPFDAQATLAEVPRGTIREILDLSFQNECRALREELDGIDPGAGFEGLARLYDQDIAGASYDLPWPKQPSNPVLAFVSIRTASGQQLHRQVELALVPVSRPCEVPALLNFGDWNASPSPSMMVALLREWGNTWSALPACMTHDVLECVVQRPPETEAQAFSLACEQWLVCGDIVSQGVGSIRAHAMQLWRSPQWFFWWD
jgi:hypothetical protein